MKKRLLSFLLATTMILSLFPVTALAEDAEIGASETADSDIFGDIGSVVPETDSSENVVTPETPEADDNTLASGTCGSNLSWVLTTDGTLTISGSGDMENYSSSSGNYADWYDYCKLIQKVVLPEGLTSIGSSAFSDCFIFTELVIPDTVTSIGWDAFEYCTALEKVTFGSGVETIGGYAFYYCQNLTEIIFPDNVATISLGAFDSCTALEKVTFGSGVKTFGDDVFYGCTSLAEVSFTGDAPSFSETAFSDVTAICYYPADNATWTETVLQNYSGTLTWVAVAEETPGEDDATGGDVGEGGFGGEDVETSEVEVPENAIAYDSISDTLTWVLTDDGILTVSGSGAIPDSYSFRDRFPSYVDKIISVVVGEGVTSIGASVFYQLSNLTSVTLADTVTQIGKEAFYYCTALEAVDLGGVSYIDEMAFYKCTALTEIVFPNDCTGFGNSAFVNSGLKTIVFEGHREITFTYYDKGQEPFARLTADAWYPTEKSWDQSYCDHFGGNLTWGTSGACGEDLIWTLVDGTLTISGEGAMTDYLAEDPAPWYGSRTSITTVVIEDGVTSIGDFAFRMCTNLTGVTIADSVTAIGGAAFRLCINLTDVIIPYDVETIGAWAFGDCYALTEITIPYNVSAIGESAFYDCSTLAKVIFEGDAPITIGENTFSGVTATCYYPSGWETWTEDVMQDYGGTVNWVGIYGFCGADADGDGEPDDNLCWTVAWEYEYDETGEIINGWPYALVISGTGAMMDFEDYCPWGEFIYEVSTVVLPEGLTHIGVAAFVGAESLTEVTIPASVESIGMMAFGGCSSLEAFAVTEGNEHFYTVGGVLFENRVQSDEAEAGVMAGDVVEGVIGDVAEGVTGEVPEEVPETETETVKALAAYPGGKHGTVYTVPSDVDVIGESAFGTLSNSEPVKVILPESVTTVENWAFGGNESKWLHFEGTAPAFAENAFGFSTLLCTYPADDSSWINVVENDYNGYSILWKGVGADGVVDSGSCGENLTWTFYVDGTLTVEGSGAMYDSPGWSDYNPYIFNVNLPDEGLTTIGDYAFFYCRALTEITIPDSVETIGDYAFADCNVLAVVEFGTEAKVTTIGENAFERCGALTEVAIPDSVTTIGDYTFFYCGALTEVTIPDSVTTIGDYAFCGCSALNGITIPDSVTAIGVYAFSECDALTEIAIPGSVAAIGNYAFCNCDALTAVTIGDGVTSIGVGAFQNCSGLAAVEFGSRVQIIGAVAFYNCDSLTVITLPDQVTTVGDSAFAGCGNLTLVSFGAGLTTLGNYAFSADLKLKSIKFTGIYPSYSNRTFGNVTATVYYPNNILWGSASGFSATWGGAAALTWVTTTDNEAPALSNAFVKTMTGANLHWQWENTDLGSEFLLSLMQQTHGEECKTLSDAVMLYWTCPEDVTTYAWQGGEDMNATVSEGNFDITSLPVPVAYAGGPAYVLALVDGSGNISWELVELETNDVTSPAIVVDEEGNTTLTAVLNDDGEAVLTWANASMDVADAMVFLDKDEDGKWDIEEGQPSVVPGVDPESGNWSLTLSKKVCEEYELTAGSEVSLLLIDGPFNMTVYTVTLQSSGDSEKPKVETLKAEPITAGGDKDEIVFELKVTDNVGVKKVELVLTNGLIDTTLESWTVSDDDKTEWSDSFSWDVTNFSSGEYTVKVTVEDKAGNKQSEEITVLLDNDAPGVYKLSAEADGEEVKLSWYCGESDVTYTIYRAVVGEDAYEEIGTATDTTFSEKPGQGEYSYYVTATDALGNVSDSCDAVTVLVDTVPPELNLVKEPDKSRVWGDIDFEVSSSDVHGVMSVVMSWTCGESAETSELSGDTVTIDTTNLAEGETLKVSFYAIDRAGNQSEKINRTYTIDNMPEPPTNLTAEVVAEGISLSWKASNPEDNVKDYVLMRAIVSVDADGNQTVGDYERIGTVDKVTLGSVIGAVIMDFVEATFKEAVEKELNAILTGNEGITVGEILENLDGYGLSDAALAALEAIQCDYLDTDVEFGTIYSYKMLAQGYSGLVSESNEASATFVDETAPVVNAIETLSKIGEALFGGDYSEVPFDVDASDAGKGQVDHVELNYTIGDQEYKVTFQLPGSYTVDVSDWASGTYTFSATAYDTYKNASEPFETTITVDNDAPVVNADDITPAVGTKISGESVQFTVPATDNIDAAPQIIVTYKLGDNTLTADNGILNTVGLPEGEFTVTVTATDRCGNSVSQDHTYIVDNVPGIPVELTVTSDGTKLTVSWKDSAEQNAGGFVLQRASDEGFTVDLKEWKLSALTRSVGLLHDDGELVHNTTYYYRVKAVSYDELTFSAWSDVVSITFLDTVAPVLNSFTASQTVCGSNTKEITLTVNADDNLNINKIVLSYSKDDEQAVELTALTDGSSFNWDISELTSGTYTVTATVYDAADNCVSGKVTVTVDKDAPTAPANVKAEGSYEWIRLTWDGDEALVKEGGSYRIERDGETVGTCNALRIYFDDPVSDYEEHTYRVVALDAVGNEACSVEVTAKKLADTTAPVIYDVWPRTGVTICHDVTIQISALDNWKVAQIEAGYSLDNGNTITWFDPAKTDSTNPVAEFNWDVSKLSGKATLYFKVTDAAGLVSDLRTEVVEIMAYGAPKAPAELTFEAEFKSATVKWTYGDTTLLKQFNVYTVENGEEVLWATVRNDHYTLTGLTEPTTVLVVAEDIYGTLSEKAQIVVVPETTEKVAPVAVIYPRELTGVVGSAVKFYGGNSTDNDAIKSWQWTFHDGKTVAAATAEKSYSAAGTYEVTLTVTDNSGNSASVTGTVTIYDVTGENATHTVLTVTVNDSTTLGTPALEGVTVTVTNGDGFETSALTDSKGKATLVVPQGECTLTAIKNGYAGAVRKIEVTSDDNGCAYQTVSLAVGGVSTLSGSLTAERMTYEEIMEAGIDVTNPANNHVVKHEFTLRFVPTVELAFDIPVSNYVNAGGQCVGGFNLGWSTYRKDGSGVQPDPGPGGGEIISEDTVTVGIFPVGKSYYLVIYGETRWLKEMFHVELILVNNSYSEDVKDCIATLNLPEGLSLAAMLDYGQSTRVSIGDIDRASVDAETGVTEFNQEQVSWYVRGDAMGEYYLSADVIGNFVNDAGDRTPINMTFETTSPIKVYAGSALHLTITAQDTAYSEQEYRVQFKLENVSHKEDPEGKGIDLYNLSFGLTGAEQYSCIIWSDGTETRFEDLDKEDFGDKMTFRVPVLKPGQCITVNFVTTCLFEADLASALVDKVTFGTMEVAFRLTDVFAVTLEGSTTEIPTTVVLEPVPKATFTEWLWGEIKDAVKDGIKDAVLQGIDALFFGGVPVTQYGVKVFEVGSDLLEDTKANSKVVVAISDGAYFLDSDNVIHTGGSATVDPAALYSLRRNAGGVAVYTDAEDYTISDDGKTMTINGEGNLYVLRTGDTGDVDPEITVTTNYLVTDPETGEYVEKTFTQILKEDVKVDENGDVVTDAEGNPVCEDYSAGLITATDVTLFAPPVDTFEVPVAGEETVVTFPHFMTDDSGTIAAAASNVVWSLTDANGDAVTEGISLVDGLLTVNSAAQAGTYTVTLSLTGTETSANQSITLTQSHDAPEGDYTCWNPTTGETYDSLSEALRIAGENEGDETIRVLKDCTEKHLLITPGTTLDLAGHTVTASYVVGMNGSYLTADANAGKLIVDFNKLRLADQSYKNDEGQYILPIWDSTQNCYLFSQFVLNTDSSKNRGLKIDEATETIYFQFKHQATRAINQTLLSDGASDNALKVIVRLTWNTGNGEAYQDFVYNDRFVGEVTGSNDYTFKLTGYSSMNIQLDTLSVVGMIITDSGVVACGETWTAEGSK